jgi:hypothetical protein
MEGKWPHFMDLCNNCNGGDDDADAWGDDNDEGDDCT